MSQLTFPQLEALYDELATAIDAAGPEQESVFLAKLVLNLAQELGDATRISALIQDSLNEPATESQPHQRLI
ncbi:DUF2783 domain-containing protein [Rhodoferax sp.]|uniref:DUF2783 domain-containing protein n=1 Tax=Rhodoferax sp. TaxID=50421 RepID=UPI00261616CF|nr:DUF2783 domain-containing protein [Rhodoferax sp.]MDD2924338.1 DUF2783 domain-containing protein [Rhodoferax sp.]